VQVQLKTILNQVQRLVGFIYQEIELLAKKGQPVAMFEVPEAGAGLWPAASSTLAA
jgi:hypothetical protein